MLSILIPIYNTEVVQLVDELIDQCTKAKINFEIICLDDVSEPYYKTVNQEINGRFCVNYVELAKNIGRARIRNRLAKLARYDWLLFLDSDSEINRDDFVVTYLDNIKHPDAQVIIGGTLYNPTPPESKDRSLHWYYGSKREALPSKIRNQHPARYFHSNNFAILQPIIAQYPFESSINGYGYEDIALGQKLVDSKISITHIDNPVQHLGLKSFSDFLNDQKESILNLAKLYKKGSIRESKLILFYEKLDRLKVRSLIISFLSRHEKWLLTKIKKKPESLFWLDLFKLQYFDRALNDTHSKE